MFSLNFIVSPNLEIVITNDKITFTQNQFDNGLAIQT